MEELRCDNCQAHLGYMAYCGPRGWVQCDECFEKDQREEQERNENKES